TYNEQITIGEIYGASATNTITFQSATGINTDVILQHQALEYTTNWVVGLIGADYISFQNITIKSTNALYSHVVMISEPAHNNSFIGNVLEAPPAALNAPPGFYSPNMAVIYAVLYYHDSLNVFIQNDILNGTYGVCIFGVLQYSDDSKTIISDNNIVGFSDYGIYTRNQIGVSIEHNIIQSASTSETCVGIKMEDFVGQFSIIGNNIHTSSNSANYGIRLMDCDLASSSALIANNFISHSNQTGYAMGISVWRSSNVNIYNNSISIISNTVSCYGLIIHCPTYSGNYHNISIVNNSIANFGLGNALYILNSSISDTLLSYHDHNNYYSTNPNVVKYGDSIVYTSADLALFEPNSIVVDPMYMSNSDLHAHSPFMNNAGTPSSFVLVDIDDNIRDTLTPDIGAHEFTLFANDVGAIAINSNTTICSGVVDVFADIKNFGINEITSLTVIWSINDVVQPSVLFTDTIPVGSIANVLLGDASFYMDSLYDISAFTQLPNTVADGNPLNDSISWLGLKTGLSGIYSIGATGDYATIVDACNYINSYGICGPTIFNIDSGVYNEQLTLENINGVSDVNTITFKSASGTNTDVVIQHNAINFEDNWVVFLNGADYVSFEDVTIKSTNSDYCRVVVLTNGAHHNSFLRNIMEAPLVDDNSSDKAVVYDWIGAGDSSNVFMNNDILNGSFGIFLNGGNYSQKASNNIISQNNFIDCRNYGLRLKFQQGIKVEQNTFLCGTNISSSYTICTGIYADFLDGAFTFVGNRIQTMSPRTNYGIKILNCHGTGLSETALIANNVIVSNVGTGTIYGIGVSSSSYTNIYNNSINITAGSVYSHGICIEIGSGVSFGNINMVNNSISNTGLGNALHIGNYAMNNNILGFHDYNNYYSTIPTFAEFGSFDVFSQWYLVTLEPHSIFSDPVYASATDLHSNSLILNGAGMPVPEVTTDFDGIIRDTISPDIGAYEIFSNIYDVQAINMPLGWSMWSTYIAPANQSIAIILDSITAAMFVQGPVEIVKNGLGEIYWPFYGINSIINHSVGRGYQVKMNTADTLHVAGVFIDPQLTGISLSAGWGIIAYLRTTAMNVEIAVASIAQSVEIIKNGSGNVYWPQYGINMLGLMVPGKGYQIKMTNQELFTYPAN
ncbi:MAG: hypothetical protein U9R19_00460, partial [Bacteroidota bacterium]|nr:hypothetical protein [Bacteroidota bacterium]